MRTIVEAFEHHCTQKSEAVCCYFIKAGQTEPITYLTLYRESSRFANLLRAQGIAAGQVVLIILNHTPALYYAFLGAMLAGIIPSFMPPPSSKQDPKVYWSSHQALFDRIEAGALVTYQDHVPLIKEQMPDLAVTIIAAEKAGQYPDQFETATISPDDLAFLQHSSGTTGLKKGVALSHRAVLEQVISYQATLDWCQTDKIVTWLPLYHDMGLIACFMLPIITGLTIIQIDPFEWVSQPQLLFEAIHRYQPTLCWMPNFAFHHLCRTVRAKDKWALHSIRAWISCSEPAKAETFDLFIKHFGACGVKAEQLQVCYAMAETVFAVTQTPLYQAVKRLAVNEETMRTKQVASPSEGNQASMTYLSTGKTISSLDCKIVDTEGEPLPDNHIGEVAVTGKCLFAGYYKQEEVTQKKMRDQWFFTGDLGFVHQGELYITGRRHDRIIVHGRNYYAHEIEALVNQIEGIKPGRCVAAGCFQPQVGTDEVIVIAETDGKRQATELISAIKQHLLDASGLLLYDVRLVPAGWLIKTTSGKISRKANLEKYLEARLAVTT